MSAPLNVLIGCEESGVVREAFRALGHNAWSCDLLGARDGSPFHIQDDARQAIKWGVPSGIVDGAIRYDGAYVGWDLGIFHPTCTYLCNSGAGRMRHTPKNPGPGILYGPARWAAMTEAAQLFADLLTCDIPRICLENPIMHGGARRAIEDALDARGEYIHLAEMTQTIQPYQFGDDASKRTGLWLRGLPSLRPDQNLLRWAQPRRVWDATRQDWINRWGNQTDSGQNKLTPSATRQRDRSETYPGIARAMAAQWGGDAREVREVQDQNPRGIGPAIDFHE